MSAMIFLARKPIARIGINKEKKGNRNIKAVMKNTINIIRVFLSISSNCNILVEPAIRYI